jgi:hypothetical protein
MSCCNHDCNEGRDCPVRVARIGRKDYDKEPYPPSPAPRYLGHLAKWMLICIAVVFAAAFTAGVLHA